MSDTDEPKHPAMADSGDEKVELPIAPLPKRTTDDDDDDKPSGQQVEDDEEGEGEGEEDEEEEEEDEDEDEEVSTPSRLPSVKLAHLD